MSSGFPSRLSLLKTFLFDRAWTGSVIEEALYKFRIKQHTFNSRILYNIKQFWTNVDENKLNLHATKLFIVISANNGGGGYHPPRFSVRFKILYL